jgi:hypothetical protein
VHLLPRSSYTATDILSYVTTDIFSYIIANTHADDPVR